MKPGLWYVSKDNPTGQLEPFEIGSVVQMAFRRKTFQWTSDHISGYEMMKWADLGDPIADDIYTNYGTSDGAQVGTSDKVAEESENATKKKKALSHFGYSRDLQTGRATVCERGVSSQFHGGNTAEKTDGATSARHAQDLEQKAFKLMPSKVYIEEIGAKFATPMPQWVDWNLLDDGCKLFERTWPFIAYTFSWAVVGGFGNEQASAVLLKSRYWSSNGEAGRIDTFRRLRETLCFLFDISCHGAEGFRPQGVSWKACLYVRWLHSRGRSNVWRTCRPVTNDEFYSLSEKEQDKVWNVERYGEPINQGELIGTLLGSSQLIIEGMEELAFGFQFTDREREAFLHLWRVVGFLFGIQDELNPNTSYKRAKALMESALCFGIPLNPVPELTHVLSRHFYESISDGFTKTMFKKVPASLKGLLISPAKLSMTAWLFLGREHANSMGLPEVGTIALALGWCRRFLLGFVLLAILKVPGAAPVAQKVMGFLFQSAVKQVHSDQPNCRFGTLPMSIGGCLGGCPVMNK